jgi:hypothetical protein
MYDSEWQTDELHGRLWKEVVVVYPNELTGTKKHHKIFVRIAAIQAKNWTQDYSNTKQCNFMIVFGSNYGTITSKLF